MSNRKSNIPRFLSISHSSRNRLRYGSADSHIQELEKWLLNSAKTLGICSPLPKMHTCFLTVAMPFVAKESFSLPARTEKRVHNHTHIHTEEEPKRKAIVAVVQAEKRVAPPIPAGRLGAVEPGLGCSCHSAPSPPPLSPASLRRFFFPFGWWSTPALGLTMTTF